MIIDQTGVKVLVKFGDSRLNCSSDIQLPHFVTNDHDFPIRTLTIIDPMIRSHKLLCYMCIRAENLLQLKSKTIFNFQSNLPFHVKQMCTITAYLFIINAIAKW